MELISDAKKEEVQGEYEARSKPHCRSAPARELITWEETFNLRPFGLEVFGALGRNLLCMLSIDTDRPVFENESQFFRTRANVTM